jgi:hypothetical protein
MSVEKMTNFMRTAIPVLTKLIHINTNSTLSQQTRDIGNFAVEITGQQEEDYKDTVSLDKLNMYLASMDQIVQFFIGLVAKEPLHVVVTEDDELSKRQHMALSLTSSLMEALWYPHLNLYSVYYRVTLL